MDIINTVKKIGQFQGWISFHFSTALQAQLAKCFLVTERRCKAIEDEKEENIFFFSSVRVCPHTGQAVETYKHVLLAVCNLLLIKIAYNALASDV